MQADVPLALRDLGGIGPGLVDGGYHTWSSDRVACRAQVDGVPQGEIELLCERTFHRYFGNLGYSRAAADNHQNRGLKRPAPPFCSHRFLSGCARTQ
jgi:hypothetical protein